MATPPMPDLSHNDLLGKAIAVRRVLIADRGEISLRIVRACRKAGLETVAGIQTAIPFHRSLVGRAGFARAEVRTGWVEQEMVH